MEGVAIRRNIVYTALAEAHSAGAVFCRSANGAARKGDEDENVGASV